MAVVMFIVVSGQCGGVSLSGPRGQVVLTTISASFMPQSLPYYYRLRTFKAQLVQRRQQRVAAAEEKAATVEGGRGRSVSSVLATTTGDTRA